MRLHTVFRENDLQCGLFDVPLVPLDFGFQCVIWVMARALLQYQLGSRVRYQGCVRAA